ncbi:hypothetical protein [Desulfitobacterium sp.]|uniref:hypothetical protein n=1 Tax=Desulfitobacterium sp. TaxID=49981 RepID=UPI002C7FA8DF|nr:hypothetical protein [Desulfitobacterium sp.]HVJ47732.1 hypothetical protein [Desulfitobacterium sp.]
MTKDILRRTILFIIIACLIFTTGCATNKQDNISVDKDKLVSVLNEKYSTDKNLKLIGDNEKVEDNYITVVSYDDLANTHYVDIVTFSVNKKDSSITFLNNKGGRADTKQPLSISSAGEIFNNKNSYLITYGEVYDNKLSSIELEYNDGQKKTQEITNNGFLVITKGDFLGINKLSAFNQNNEVVYSFP